MSSDQNPRETPVLECETLRNQTSSAALGEDFSVVFVIQIIFIAPSIHHQQNLEEIVQWMSKVLRYVFLQSFAIQYI
jgi:hypothetical protein